MVCLAMRTVISLYTFGFLFCIFTITLIFGNYNATQTGANINDYQDFDDPLVVSLLRAASISTKLPVNVELLRYLSKLDGRTFFEVHNDITSWYRSQVKSSVSVSTYSGCTCGRIEDSCNCVINLIPSPIPVDKNPDSVKYHPILSYENTYVNFNFGIKFDLINRNAAVSGFISGTLGNSSHENANNKPLFRGVNLKTEGYQTVCASTQSVSENLPQVSLCLTIFDVKSVKISGVLRLHWCSSVSVLINDRLIHALYPLGCIDVA